MKSRLLGPLSQPRLLILSAGVLWAACGGAPDRSEIPRFGHATFALDASFGDAGDPTYVPEPRIPSNFDAGQWLATGGTIPASSTDNVGWFRMVCNPSHQLFDDPLRLHAQPGHAPLRQFFGNTLANADSTYVSLRTTGDSTCPNRLNRTTYSVPAMMNGKGQVVRPDYISVFYVGNPEGSPPCSQSASRCVPMPSGLRAVFGFDPAITDGGVDGHPDYVCTGPTATAGTFLDLPSLAAGCPTGNQLIARIGTPNCWNGAQLDSPDHRSHLAYGSYGSWGYYRCPATHPFLIPNIALWVTYTVDDDLRTWHLTTDVTPEGVLNRPGLAFDGVLIEAWDDDVKDAWTDGCINQMLSCASAALGNGDGLKLWSGFSWSADPRLVAPPDGGLLPVEPFGPDGGSRDGGEVRLHANVGCGCDATDATAGFVLLALGWFVFARRRRAHP